MAIGLKKLASRLLRTHNAIMERLDAAVGHGSRQEALETIEEALIAADIGVETSMEIVDSLREGIRWDMESLRARIRESIYAILKDAEVPSDASLCASAGPGPYIMMVLGVNGVGKTTIVGKLAARFSSEGRTVILAAADTFRAAAVEQLEIWGERVGCKVISHKHRSDPAAVAYDAINAALARGADAVIIDTAGRLHTKTNLMEELGKIDRVISREIEGAPYERLLVLDATTGQNALVQARTFNQEIGVTSLALTKLDGTAKGGIIVAVSRELKLPIRYIGVGEGIDDLVDFSASEFTDALI